MARESEPTVDPEVASIMSEGGKSELKKERTDGHSFLSDLLPGLKPATTPAELQDQIYRAQVNDCDSIFASDELIRHYTKRTDQKVLKKIGYFIYDSVKVWFSDAVVGESTDQINIHDLVFKDSKVKA